MVGSFSAVQISTDVLAFYCILFCLPCKNFWPHDPDFLSLIFDKLSDLIRFPCDIHVKCLKQIGKDFYNLYKCTYLFLFFLFFLADRRCYGLLQVSFHSLSSRAKKTCKTLTPHHTTPHQIIIKAKSGSCSRTNSSLLKVVGDFSFFWFGQVLFPALYKTWRSWHATIPPWFVWLTDGFRPKKLFKWHRVKVAKGKRQHEHDASEYRNELGFSWM